MEQKDEGLLDLAKSLPRDLKEFTIVLHSWEGFKGEFLTNMVENLPRSLKSISIISWSRIICEFTDFLP